MDIIKLKKLVLQEIENLKIYATYEEIGKLDFTTFKPFMIGTCIYGQMTGNCFSDRATVLLDLCTIPYSDYTSAYWPTNEMKFAGNRTKLYKSTIINVFSPLEYYIFNYSETNEKIIAYLKGEIQTLNL